MNELITVNEAVELCRGSPIPTLVKASKPTIIDWCVKYGIGYQVGSKWVIERKKLQLILDGKQWKLEKES